jgi:tungstate transport system substrate-binding protein
MKNIICRVAAAALTTVAFLALSGVASADSPTTLTIIGTSDVSDSGLFQNVIGPQFKAAYPQFNIQYFGTASGTAISDAETGAAVSGGGSVLLVHAASLENQFVASGYSYNDQPGYSVFRNDFVLAGPTSDPAHDSTQAPNNIAQAFVNIANAGNDGEAGQPAVTFVSRGGTPGTTVEEHAIWALIDSSGLRPSTLTLCTVSPQNGGGETPVASNIGFTNGAACSDLPGADQASGLPSGAGLPDWYVTTGANQGANVLDANACTSGANGIKSPANTCYVFTDRGTYDWLSTGTDPAGQIKNLGIVTRNNSASAPGGQYALINYFHAYIINQAKVQAATGSKAAVVNLTAAQDLITLLTSPGFQASLQNYLATTGATTSNLTPASTLDAGGAPFIGDAAPIISASGFPLGNANNPAGSVNYGSSVKVTGTVTNPQPGYAVLGAQPINIDEIVGGIPVPVAEGLTGANGGYSIKFSPKTSGQYEVETDPMTQVENATLSPQFIDTLSEGTSALYAINVTGSPAAKAIRFKKVKLAAVRKKAKTDKLTVTVNLSPAPRLKGATVALRALNLKTGKSKKIGHVSVKAGKATCTVTGKLNVKTKYVLQLAYTQRGQKSLYSALKTVSAK